MRRRQDTRHRVRDPDGWEGSRCCVRAGEAGQTGGFGWRWRTAGAAFGEALGMGRVRCVRERGVYARGRASTEMASE